MSRLLNLLVRQLLEFQEKDLFVFGDAVDGGEVDFCAEGLEGPGAFDSVEVEVDQVDVLVDEEDVLVDQVDFGVVDVDPIGGAGEDQVGDRAGELDDVEVVVELALDDGGDGEEAVLGGQDVHQKALDLGVADEVQEEDQGAVGDQLLETDRGLVDVVELQEGDRVAEVEEGGAFAEGLRKGVDWSAH